VLIGSVRGEEDEELVRSLKQKSEDMGFSDKDVLFAINLSFGELQSYLTKAKIGLHTMWNEHFGIGVAEMMVS
jgi:alpha-1,2-mannosyltransferase